MDIQEAIKTLQSDYMNKILDSFRAVEEEKEAIRIIKVEKER